MTAETVEKIRPLLPAITLDWSSLYAGASEFVSECRRYQDAIFAEAYPGAILEAQEMGEAIHA